MTRAQAALNAVVLEDAGVLERVYLRADYAYTVLRDIIRNNGGQFVNSGERGIHSVEFLARADSACQPPADIGGRAPAEAR